MSENTFSLGTVIEDAKKVITDPFGFYREMPASGGFADPAIFVAVMGAAAGLIFSVFGMIGLGGAGGMGMAGGMALSAIILMPIGMIIGSFIGAAIVFVIWKLMGSDKNYETAYRCVAYSTAIMPVVALVSIIPYVATLARTLWGMMLLYAASIEVHELKAQTAKIVFGVLAAVLVITGISGERATRNMQHTIERSLSKSGLPGALKDLENMDEMTAEETGKAVGDFLKGLEKAAREMEQEEAASKSD